MAKGFMIMVMLEKSVPNNRQLSLSSYISQRRQWHPTPVLLPGKSMEKSLVGYIAWAHKSWAWLSTKSPPPPVIRASQVVLVVKNPPANAGDIKDVGSISRSGRYPEGENDNPLQYSYLENPMDRGAWQATVNRVAKSHSRLKQFSMPTSNRILATLSDFRSGFQ